MTDDPFGDVVREVVEILDQAGVIYAITGSVASSTYGRAVTTQDIDIAVRMTPEQARTVARALPQKFYRSEDALVEAARSFGMANLIDTETQLTVDICALAPSDYHEQVFARRRIVELGPDRVPCCMVSPEDIILMKLVWRKESRSTKQWKAALGVARVRGARMDWKYLFEQAKALGLTDDLTALRDEAGI